MCEKWKPWWNYLMNISTQQGLYSHKSTRATLLFSNELRVFCFVQYNRGTLRFLTNLFKPNNSYIPNIRRFVLEVFDQTNQNLDKSQICVYDLISWVRDSSETQNTINLKELTGNHVPDLTKLLLQYLLYSKSYSFLLSDLNQTFENYDVCSQQDPA